MFQTRIAEIIKTHIFCSTTFFRDSHTADDITRNIWYGQTGHKWRYTTV